MAPRPEHIPGEAAPAAGTYEQRNIFGSLIGTRVSLAHGAIDAVSPGGAHVDARRGGSGRVLKGAPFRPNHTRAACPLRISRPCLRERP
jgi:hypothetical protein